MRNRYLVLFLVAMAVAVLLATIRPTPKRAAPATSALAQAPVVTMRIEVADGLLSPPHASVPKDHLVSLEIVNRGARPASVTLAGYEDRLTANLAPGASRHFEFLADRPGEDFPWLVDGRPIGRLVVAGEHLAEHRR